MTITADLRSAALDYARRGLHVHPLRPKDKRPATEHGWKDATTDPTQVEAWWERQPEANIGIACRLSGVVVLDIDADDRSGGFDSFAKLEAELGQVPMTVRSITGGGGEHVFFKHPGGELLGQFGPGVEIKDGHYVVAPPSLHPSGRRYEWACDEGPGEVELADVPERWLTAMRKPASATSISRVGDHDDPLREIPPPEYFAKLANVRPGRDGKVSCPIPGHRDEDPSCHVYSTPEKGWCCFTHPGGKVGGSIYDLAMRLWDVPFVEAKDRLLREYGGDGAAVTIEGERAAVPSSDPQRRELAEALMDASDESVELDRKTRITLLDRKFFTPIGLAFEGALRFGRRQSHWLIDLRDVKTRELHRQIDLGRTSDLSQRTVRDAIFEATGRSIPVAEAKDWTRFREWLHALAVLEESGGGEQLTCEWLSSFMDGDRATEVDMTDKAALAEALDEKVECFRGSDGCTYVRRGALVQHVTLKLGRTTADDISLRLRKLGFRPEQVAARVGDKVTKGRYWRSPRGFDADA